MNVDVFEATAVDPEDEALIDEDGPNPTVPPAFGKPVVVVAMGVAAFLAVVAAESVAVEDDEVGTDAIDKLLSAFLGTLDCCSDCCCICCCCCCIAGCLAIPIAPPFPSIITKFFGSMD
jgi:hypothetical protein